MTTLAQNLQAGPAVSRTYLPARCGAWTCAVPAAWALAVLRLDNLTIAHGAPAHVMGVANTRFGVVAVISLARWLDPRAPDAAPGGPAVLIERGAETIALAVDEFAEAFTARQDEVDPTDVRQTAPRFPRSAGALRLGAQVVPILDLASLFDPDAPAESFPPVTPEGAEP